MRVRDAVGEILSVCRWAVMSHISKQNKNTKKKYHCSYGPGNGVENKIKLKMLISLEKNAKKRKKNIPQAQTTPDASFGPVFFFVAPPNPRRQCNT